MSRMDEMLFFDPMPGAGALYEALREQVMARFPDTEIRVQKSQISFYGRHMFLCVSMLGVKRKAERPPVYVTVTFGLGEPVSSARIAAKTEPYPGRWTHHVLVGSLEEIDEELLGWIGQAHAFVERK